jgi:hypothetical protein
MLLLAVTGWGKQEDKDQARNAGFDEHRTTPVDPDELVQLLARFLEPTDVARPSREVTVPPGLPADRPEAPGRPGHEVRAAALRDSAAAAWFRPGE